MSTARPWHAIAGIALPLLLAAGPATSRSTPDVLPEIAAASLPKEARQTLALIRSGGPYPYQRDGIVFANRERRLPPQPRGYYHEYTVTTPGAGTRGAAHHLRGRDARARRVLLFRRPLSVVPQDPAMKVPDLSIAADAGVLDWTGAPDAIKAAAAAAKLRFCVIDLQSIGGKSELMSALGRGLKLPEHFGNNWDALADCLEDSDWLGKYGIAILLRHAKAYGKVHHPDLDTLSEILSEAVDYWRELHKPFWVFVA